ncbi:MAG: hypothetical protein V4461_06825, partial [Pseudomonadota bacterium]
AVSNGLRQRLQRRRHRGVLDGADDGVEAVQPFLQDLFVLRDAGVQGIYGPGSNVVECAADVLRLLGHNMPPLEDAA